RGRDAVSRGDRSFAARPGDLYPDRAVDAVRRHRAGRVTMKQTTKGFPAVLTAGLVIMWLLLNQTLAPGQILLGLVLALLLVWASTRLRPLWPRLERAWRGLPLIVMVILDIVRSNIGVARIVLGLVRDREIRSGFVNIPLDMRDPHGLA